KINTADIAMSEIITSNFSLNKRNPNKNSTLIIQIGKDWVTSFLKELFRKFFI
ncbi:MAG: hypothetical protein ACI8SA_000426, partial [Dokdonia sp.]